jgi:hypothetical protein
MVYTAVPPDYFDNAAPHIVQQARSGVNSLEKERLDNAEEGNLPLLSRHWAIIMS